MDICERCGQPVTLKGGMKYRGCSDCMDEFREWQIERNTSFAWSTFVAEVPLLKCLCGKTRKSSDYLCKECRSHRAA